MQLLHHTSLLKNNSSNTTSTAAITTTTNDPTPSTSTKHGHYVNGDGNITTEKSNDEHTSLSNDNASNTKPINAITITVHNSTPETTARGCFPSNSDGKVMNEGVSDDDDYASPRSTSSSTTQSMPTTNPANNDILSDLFVFDDEEIVMVMLTTQTMVQKQKRLKNHSTWEFIVLTDTLELTKL